MIRQSVVCHLKKNLFRRYHKFPQTKPRLDGPALAGLDTRPGQSPHEAGYLAWLGLAYFGLALAGSRPQAGPGKTLPSMKKGKNSTMYNRYKGSAWKWESATMVPLFSWIFMSVLTERRVDCRNV